MRPLPVDWLIASRFMLPVWIGLGLYLWFSQGGSWEAFSSDQQLAFMVTGGIFAIAYLKAFPSVFFYEREQALYRRSHSSPEEQWRRKTVYQTVFLILLAAGAIYFGFNWWKSEPAPQTTSYKAAGLGVGGVGIVASAAYLKLKNWKRPAQTIEQPALVRWCLPVPSAAPTQADITRNLPDYCLPLLSKAQPLAAPDKEHLRFADVRTQHHA